VGVQVVLLNLYLGIFHFLKIFTTIKLSEHWFIVIHTYCLEIDYSLILVMLQPDIAYCSKQLKTCLRSRQDWTVLLRKIRRLSQCKQTKYPMCQ